LTSEAGCATIDLEKEGYKMTIRDILEAMGLSREELEEVMAEIMERD